MPDLAIRVVADWAARLDVGPLDVEQSDDGISVMLASSDLGLYVTMSGGTFQAAMWSTDGEQNQLVGLTDLFADRGLVGSDGGVAVAPTPLPVQVNAAEELLPLLESPARHLPVLVSTPAADGSYPLDLGTLASAMRYRCHLVVLTEESSWPLTEAVGRERSAFGGAVRLYQPGFHRTSNPSEHRYWTFDRARSMGDTLLRDIKQRVVQTLSTRVRLVPPKPTAATTADSAIVAELRTQVETLTVRLDRALQTIALLQAGAGDIPDDVPDAIERVADQLEFTVVTAEARNAAAGSPYRHPERVAAALVALDDAAFLLGENPQLDVPIFLATRGIRSSVRCGELHIELGSGPPERRCVLTIELGERPLRVVHIGQSRGQGSG